MLTEVRNLFKITLLSTKYAIMREMENKLSLLNKIKAKFILKYILSLAYENFSSVFNLVKYNKSLMNKLDINLKNMKYVYKSFSEIKKGKA